jgi:hypothetical protein
MNNFLKKHKIASSVIAFLLIVVGLCYWAGLFVAKRIKTKANLIQERVIDNNLEKLKIEKIPRMEETNAEFEKNKEAIGTILAANSKVDFIKYIESLAEETNNGIEIKVLSENQDKSVVKEIAKETVKKDAVKKDKKSIEDGLLYKQYISMQVDLTGNYQSFLNFMHKLENNKYYVNIVSFNLKKETAEKEDLLKNENSGSGDIFFSPSSSQNIVEIKKNEDAMTLKSSLNILVYIE